MGRARLGPLDNPLREDRQEAQTGQRQPGDLEQDPHDKEPPFDRLLPDDQAENQVLRAARVDEQQERTAGRAEDHPPHRRLLFQQQGDDGRDICYEGDVVPLKQ